MRRIYFFLFAICVILLGSSVGVAQSPATGLYQFGSFDNQVFDTINRGNLNVHLSIPIASKSGRGGSNFTYALTYDSSIWSPVGVSGSQVWTPVAAFGWQGQTAPTLGYISYGEVITPLYCLVNNQLETWYFYNYAKWTYTDTFGTSHHFAMPVMGAGNPPSPNCAIPPAQSNGSAVSIDGAGFTLSASVTTSSVQASITTRSGEIIDAPLQTPNGAGIATDPNGNEITVDGAGHFIDTTGKTVLTITGTNPVVYTYTDSNGNADHVTVNYTSYTVQTNFGVSGIGEYSQTNIPLVSSIVYSADNSSYAFTYEPTPGNTSATTGRLASIKLRTGNTISYVYTGGNNGIESDGSTAGLTRTTTDGTVTYTRSAFTDTSSTTQIVDPAGNNGVYTFLENSFGYIYENSHSLYTGAVSGTPVEQVTTCFSATVTCVTPSVNGYIASITTTTTRNGTTIGTDTQTFTGPELLAQDVGPTGITTTNTYDTLTGPNGINFYRLATQTNGQSSTTYNYDETTPTPTTGLPQHIAVTTSRGNLTSVHQLVSGTTTIPTQTMTYDDAGQVLTAKDGNGNITTYGHDSTDTFVTQITQPVTNGVNHISSAVYDITSGLMTSSTDENNQPTTYSYDGLERPSTINYPDGGKTTYSYTPTSTTQEVLESGTTTLNTTTDLGGLGRVDHVYSPNGSVVDTTHDPDGRVECVSNPHVSGSSPTDGNTCYSYDVLNRIVTVTNPDNTHKTISYTGATATITDEAGHLRSVTTDALGRIASLTEPNASNSLAWTTVYTYNPLNEATEIQQQGGTANSALWRTRTFGYDDMGRPTSQTTPEAGTTTFGYDSSSNLTSRVDARNITTTYTYDALNRKLTEAAPGLTNNYVYDTVSGVTLHNAIGRLGREGNGVNANEVYSYDAMGRVNWEASQTPSVPNDTAIITQATYDLAGNMTSLTYPDGRVISQTYNLGLLAGVTYTSWNGQSVSVPYLSSTSYGPPGNLTGETLGNGVQMIAGDNSRLSLTSLLYKTATQTLWSKQYTWSTNAVNLTTVTDMLNSAQTYTYGYDPDNRITSASATGVSESYTIDPWGNMQQSGNFSFTQPIGSNNQISASGYTYDAAGDLTADGLGNTYQYDADGMITASSGAQYIYDALKQRVAKTGGSNPTETIYFAGQAIALHNPTGGAWTDLIYSNGAMVAEVAGIQTATPEYRLLDHLGSLAVQTNNSGTVTGANVFLPFGELMSTTTSDSFQFTSLPQDTENSSYHAWFRNLSATQGRWLRPDPYNGSYDITNPQSFNRYAYVMNNPMTFVDPTGLELVEVCDASTNTCTIYDTDGGGGGETNGGGDGSCEPGATCVVVSGGPDPITPNPLVPWVPPGNNPTGGGGGVGVNTPRAPSNNTGCSVLDTNCKNPGQVQKYINFLSCEAAIAIYDVGAASPASYGALTTGAVGVKQMISFLNGASKGVPVINEIAAIYVEAMASIEAVKVNQVCTAAVYGD